MSFLAGGPPREPGLAQAGAWLHPDPGESSNAPRLPGDLENHPPGPREGSGVCGRESFQVIPDGAGLLLKGSEPLQSSF